MEKVSIESDLKAVRVFNRKIFRKAEKAKGRAEQGEFEIRIKQYRLF